MDEEGWNKIRILTDTSNCILIPPESTMFSAVAFVQAIGEPIRIPKKVFFSEEHTFDEEAIKKEAVKSLKKKLLELANSIED
jgi:hypothetical protein